MKRAYGLEIPETLAETVVPERCALIVYDMQVGILRQLVDASSVLQRVTRVLEAARGASMRTVFMRHLSMPKELSGVFQLRMAMAWQRTSSVDDVQPWFLRDSPAFHLSPELTPRVDEAILDKITMSAFEGTPLEIVLRDCGLSAFLIVGVATEIGIEPTVRHGADLGFIPVVVADACGAGDKEAGERALANLQHLGDAIVATTDEVCEALGRGLTPR